MKTPCPPLENKGKNALDGPMKDNDSVNSEPDMSGSLASPKPNIKKGYSRGNIHGGEDSLTDAVTRDPFAEAGYYDDEY